jgi:hypothetical protein
LKDLRNDGEFHRADPAWRRRMQGLLVVIALLGLAAVAALHLWLSKLHGLSAGGLADHQVSLYRVMGGMCIAFGVAAAAFSLWLFRIAAAARAERRWPPSSMRTSADVRIRYLTSADVLVTQMRVGAVALAVLAVGLFGWSAWLLKGG